MSPSRPRSWTRRSLRKLTAWLSYQFQVSRRPLVTIEGVRIRLGRHMSRRMVQAVSRGTYQRDKLRLIGMVLSPSDVVLELGAGLGLVSAYCAQRVGSGRVFAFEANPDLEPRIRETYALNQVEPALEMSAVRANSGRVTLYRDARRLNSSSTAPRGTDAIPVEVPGKALSYVVEKIRPTLLIVDAESAEGELFDRARLAGVTRVVIGLQEKIVALKRIQDIRHRLAGLGFREDRGLSSNEHLVFRR